MQPWLNISDYTVSMKVGSSWNVGLLFLTASLAFSVEQTLCRSLPWAQARKTCSWSIILFCPPETLYLNDVSLHFPPESHSSELSLYAVRGIITSCVFLPSFNDSCGAINAATPARALALSSTAEPENKPLIKIQTCESLSFARTSKPLSATRSRCCWLWSWLVYFVMYFAAKADMMVCFYVFSSQVKSLHDEGSDFVMQNRAAFLLLKLFIWYLPQ